MNDHMVLVRHRGLEADLVGGRDDVSIRRLRKGSIRGRKKGRMWGQFDVDEHSSGSTMLSNGTVKSTRRGKRSNTCRKRWRDPC